MESVLDKGFAIQTTLERMECAFDRFRGCVDGSPVRYLDFSREMFDYGNVFSAMTVKDLPYRDEREFRLLFWRPDLKNADVPVEESGVRVRVDLSMLIENIYVSPHVPSVPDAIARILEERQLPVAKSSIRHVG